MRAAKQDSRLFSAGIEAFFAGLLKSQPGWTGGQFGATPEFSPEEGLAADTARFRVPIVSGEPPDLVTVELGAAISPLSGGRWLVIVDDGPQVIVAGDSTLDTEFLSELETLVAEALEAAPL